MSIYKWFKIFNSNEFDDLDIPSKTYDLELDGLGQKSFLVTKSNLTGITYEGVYLPLHLNDKNPFEFEDLAVYENADTHDCYLGILQPEE